MLDLENVCYFLVFCLFDTSIYCYLHAVTQGRMSSDNPATSHKPCLSTDLRLHSYAMLSATKCTRKSTIFFQSAFRDGTDTRISKGLGRGSDKKHGPTEERKLMQIDVRLFVRELLGSYSLVQIKPSVPQSVPAEHRSSGVKIPLF